MMYRLLSPPERALVDAIAPVGHAPGRLDNMAHRAVILVDERGLEPLVARRAEAVDDMLNQERGEARRPKRRHDADQLEARRPDAAERRGDARPPERQEP